MHDGMGWWMVFGGIWMVLFWAAIIWLVVWGVGQVTGNRQRDAESPLDIARRRYASGEITREEFEQLGRDLG
jgi:putative membrane protein